ncbi:MAG: hypothetical protein KGI38_12935, partial [Thaumarchaeota archaeon]|nr:hypothetical protein [Nitrososphaerota archaeon]
QARGRDVVVVDTAGRLHTQTNLMEELAKVRRVLAGRLAGAPHGPSTRRVGPPSGCCHRSSPRSRSRT